MHSTKLAQSLGVVCAVFVAACGSSSHDPAATEIPYADEVHQAEAVTGFSIYVPTHVPEPLPQVPTIEPFEDLAVFLFIGPEDAPNGEQAWLNFLEIKVSPVTGTVCPPCPNDPPELEHFETRWGETAEQQVHRPDTISQHLYFIADSVWIEATLIWYFDGDAPPELPDDLHDESIRIIESLSLLSD
jgi:hypothetical protein